MTPRYPGWLNVNKTWDFAASLTHVAGRHTIKSGVAFNHSFKAQNMTQGVAPMGTINFGENTNNPNDTQLRLCQHGHRDLQHVLPGLEVHRVGHRVPRDRAVHPGQLEGHATG